VSKFEIGDVVSYKGSGVGYVAKYRVDGVSPDGIHLWLKALDTTYPAYTGIAAVYYKVQPFFEMGKKYTRFVPWSISFQRGRVHEVFEPLYVAVTSKGNPNAFGKLYLQNAGDDFKLTQYTSFTFDQGWEEYREGS
jgi:hypothetical protein